jgi:serine/threonine protein kinase/Tfp pilus assembly protein PilF
MSLVGKTIGRIRILDILGQGGMGEVYVAFDEVLKRKVAVKAIGAGIRLDPRAKARFLREARVLSQLEDPHICQIHDYIDGVENDFLILEFIEGKTLSRAMREELTKAQKVRIAEQIAQVLALAHGKGVVHRDLKPANIMLVQGDQVKVLDFGLASFVKSQAQTPRPLMEEDVNKEKPSDLEEEKLADLTLTLSSSPAAAEIAPSASGLSPASFETRHGMIMGTLLYMSPEQARGEDVGPSSDMYSFGLLLQELFTGRPPYEQTLDGALLLARAAKAETSPVSGLSGDLTKLINQLKSLAPAARPTALGAADRLKRIREKPARRIRAAVVAAILMTFLAMGLKYVLDLRRERSLALQARDEAANVVEFLVNLFQVSDPGEARGNTITAREILSKSAQEISQGLERQPLTRARLMGTIGSVYQKLGLYRDAEPLLGRALQIRQQLLGPKDPLIAESLNSLAGLYELQSRLPEAEALCQKSLNIRTSALPSDHPAIAESLNLLARIHHQNGKFKDADSLFHQALAIREKALGPNHPAVAESLTDLGRLYYTESRFDDAEKCYQRALVIKETILGADHPDVGQGLNSLAGLYLWLRRYADAEPLYKRALAIREKTLGPVHPDVAVCLYNLGILYYYQKEWPEAEKFYRQALDIQKKALGEFHPDVADTYEALAQVFHESGKYKDAEPFYQHALAINEKTAGQDHPQLSHCLNNLGILYTDLGKFSEAESVLLRSLRIQEKAWGVENPRLARTLEHLGDLYSKSQKLDAAKAAYGRALAVVEKEYGPEHSELAAPLIGLGSALAEQGHPEEAEKTLLRALAIGEKNADLDREIFADGLFLLAKFYHRKLVRPKQAEQFYKRALEVQEKATGAGSKEVKSIIAPYAELLRSLGRAEEAEKIEVWGKRTP